MTLPLDELPGGWVGATLGEISRKIQYGYTATSDSRGGGPKYLRITDIQRGLVDWDTVPHCVCDELSDYRLAKGDIVIARTGATTGKSFLIRSAPVDSVFASYLIRVQLSENATPEFVNCFLQSPCYWEQISTVSKGTAQPGANASILGQLELPLPPLPEQGRIVAKIEALQARSRKACEALEAIPLLLDQLRQSVLAAAFRGDLTAVWREQHPDVEPASLLLERIRVERRHRWEQAELAKFKAKGKVPTDDSWKEQFIELQPVDESDLPELPDGWCWASLHEIVHGLHQGWSPKCENEATDDPDTWAVIKTTAVQAMSFLPHENKKLPRNLEPAVDLEIREQDLLITRAGPRVRAGVMCLVGAVRKKLILCDKVYCFRADGGLAPSYLELALNSPQCVRAIDRLKTGISDSGVNLTQEKFLELSIPVPPMSEQQAIVEIARQFWNTAISIESIIKELANNFDALDQSMLAKAFRGELVPQDPNDEPASVLLERIRSNGAAKVNNQPKGHAAKRRRKARVKS